MHKAKYFNAVAFALLVQKLLLAHHGQAGFYDHTKTVRIEGVVQKFEWHNPHIGLFFVGK